MEEIDKLVDLIDKLKTETPVSIHGSLAKDGRISCTDTHYCVTYDCSQIRVIIDLYTIYKDFTLDYNVITILDKMNKNAEMCTLKLAWAPFGREDLATASKQVLRYVFTKL